MDLYHVSVVPCGDYDDAQVEEALREVLEPIGGLDFVRPGMTVGVKATLKTAWLLSAAAFPMTLAALLLPEAAFWLSFLMNPNAFYGMLYLWAFAVIAVIAYLNSFLYRRAFRKLPEEFRQL